jgi:pimeloyl-ACP methyl ester carboxylesterase
MGEMGDFPFEKDEPVKFDQPTLVIRGAKSKYIKDSQLPLFNHFFPNNQVVSLNTGHWVHAEE